MAHVNNELSAEELQQAVVYIIPSIKKGEEVAVNRKRMEAPVSSVMLFIDLEPKANWSHRCKYIWLSTDGEIIESEHGQFPPDDKNLKLLYKSDDIESWMLLTEDNYRE